MVWAVLNTEYKNMSEGAIEGICESAHEVYTQLLENKWDLDKTPDYLEWRQLERKWAVGPNWDGLTRPPPRDPFSSTRHWKTLVRVMLTLIVE